MSIFQTLVLNILPLFLLIGFGYGAGKWHQADRKTLANVLFYYIAPVVFFSSVLKAPMSGALVVLPFITFGLACLLCMLAYRSSGWFWQDETRNLLALSAGTGNLGYFGLPVALVLFNDAGVGIYMAAMLGNAIFENTLGYFMVARGRHDAREALQKLVRLPALYAFILGVAGSWAQLSVPESVEHLFVAIRGAYIVIGMMIIGLGLSAMPRLRIDVKFTSFVFAVKFIAWPMCAAAIILFDRTVLHFLGGQAHQALLLLSFMPPAANTVVFATLLDIKPTQMAGTVLFCTCVGLFSVPLMVMLFL